MRANKLTLSMCSVKTTSTSSRPMFTFDFLAIQWNNFRFTCGSFVKFILRI